MSNGGVSLGVGRVKRSTEKAILVELDSYDDEVWVPKSVIHDDSMLWKGELYEEGDLVVAEWWAESNGYL